MLSSATRLNDSDAMRSYTNRKHLRPQSQGTALILNLMCHISYVNMLIYVIECICGKKNVGRTMQKLHNRANKHCSNRCKKCQLHSLSRHCASEHPGVSDLYKILPIDHLDPSVHDKFENLKNREVYFMYRLQTL